tara:strand:- start:1494 stop:2504 length:1011 start_codon:yes stop_codon:yes gene_type:complete
MTVLLPTEEVPKMELTKISKVMLWLNSGCNAKCASCDIWRENSGQKLSLSFIQKLSFQLKDMSVKTVVICGEPLMHDEIWEIVKVLKQRGFIVELLTNGFLLKRHAFRAVDLCDVIRVSLDGPELVHNRTRGKSHAYSLLKEGVKEIRRISKNYDISGRCAVNRGNYQYIRDTIYSAKALLLSGISFSATDSQNEEAFRRELRIDEDYSKAFLLTKEDTNALNQELEKIGVEFANEFNSGFIQNSPEELHEILISYYKERSGGPLRSLSCNAPLTSIVIEYDGTIRPCFPMAKYGKIKEPSELLGIINSAKAINFRKNLHVVSNDICRCCVDQTCN